jgi:divalent metal cation (Fe/Co/Zn/Cd) transporter
MMRRAWIYARDLVWTSIVAVALAVASLALVVLGMLPIAQVLAALAITFAILSVRS